MSPAFARQTIPQQPEPLFAPTAKASKSNLRIGAPGDAFEHEADRVADKVMTGGRIPEWSLAKINGRHIQRQPTADLPVSQQPTAPKPNNYSDAAKKLGEAFLQTDVGKKLKDAVSNDPLAKAVESFVATLPGKIITGAAAAGVVSGLAAAHQPLPVQIPEIPLDSIHPGLKVKITYEGPVNQPTKAMVTFSYSPQGEKKKSPQTDSERYRAETARMAADQEKFREGMKYAPGSPQAQQQEAEKKMIEDWTLHRFGAVPGTGGVPLVPPQAQQQPAGGPQLQMPEFQSLFTPHAPTLLDKKLELQPMTLSSGPVLQRKCACQESGTGECEECKKAGMLQRQAAGPSEAEFAPPIVDNVLSSAGRPLDKATREYFEPRFGCDLSRIRIHNDTRAAESARAVNAVAYTVGNSIAFASGRYSPHSSEGRRLLAHELVHTVQQSSTPVRPPFHGTSEIETLKNRQEHQPKAAAEWAGRGSRTGAPHSPSIARRQISSPTLQRSPDPYAKYSIPELRKLAVTDPAAAEALRARYHAMSNVELERYARSDPAAQSEYSQRTVVSKAAEGQGPFSNRQIRDALENDIRQQRASSGIPRREPTAVAPDVDPEGGTIGAARTDILGLENRAFLGRSPRAGGQVNPTSKFPPASDLTHTHGHAEQGIADELEAALRDIPRDQLKGRTVWMLIEQEPCSTCAQGISNAKVDPGVLKKLAQEFPEVTFEIKNLRSSSILVLKGSSSSGSLDAPTESSQTATGAAQKPSADAVQVKTDIEVKNVVKNSDGSTVMELEYNLGENLAQLNRGAPAGGEVPARITIRVTTNAEGAITSVESLSGEPAALVEALARQTLTEGLAAGGASGETGALAAVSKGMKIGGWIAFVAITGYQLFKATPSQRPRVLAQATGGLVGGTLAGFGVCNALLDLETAGWGVLICGLLAGGAGGVAGSAAGGEIYDKATATELDKWLKEVDQREKNERVLFNVVVGSLGPSAQCVEPAFVKSFLSIVPPKMKDYEVVLVAGQVGGTQGTSAVPSKSSFHPATHLISHQMYPAPRSSTGTICPNCHRENPGTTQSHALNFDQKQFDEILHAPSCDQVLNAKLKALETAIRHLPEAPRPIPKVRPKFAPGLQPAHTPASSFPTVQEQRSKDICPSCHREVQSQIDKSLLSAPPLTEDDLRRFGSHSQQQQPAVPMGTHETPRGFPFSSSQPGFPSMEEQRGSTCSNCHQPTQRSDIPAWMQGSGGFGSGRERQIDEENRNVLEEWIKAQQK